jgi:hypothetical protein
MVARWPYLALAALASSLSVPAHAADDQSRDPLGLQVLFERTEVRSGDLVVGPEDLVTMRDGGLLAVNIFGKTFTRFDPHGRVIWERDPSGGEPRDTAALPAGGFVSVGVKHVSPISVFPPGVAIKGNIDLWLGRFDDDGALLWEKTFGDLGLEMGQSVAALEDGSVALVGAVDARQTWLIRLTPQEYVRRGRHFGGSTSTIVGLPNGDAVVLSQVPEFAEGGCGPAFDPTPLKMWRFDEFNRLRGVVTARDRIAGSNDGCHWDLELLSDPTNPETVFVSSILDEFRMPVGLEVAKVHLEHGPVWSRPVFAPGEDEPCRPTVAAASNGDLVVACSRRGPIDIHVFAGADGRARRYRAHPPECDRTPEVAAGVRSRIRLAAWSDSRLALAGASYTRDDACSWLAVFSLPPNRAGLAPSIRRSCGAALNGGQGRVSWSTAPATVSSWRRGGEGGSRHALNAGGVIR